MCQLLIRFVRTDGSNSGFVAVTGWEEGIGRFLHRRVGQENCWLQTLAPVGKALQGKGKDIEQERWITQKG